MEERTKKLLVIILSVIICSSIITIPLVLRKKNSESPSPDSPTTIFPKESDDEESDDEPSNKILEIHNKYRKDVKFPELIWDETLANSAQEYADTLLEKGIFEHSNSKGKYGENLAYELSSQKITTKNAEEGAVADWYNERINNNTCEFSLETGHYTQLIWKDTTKLGCGTALSNDGKKVYVVCQYKPPGNISGQFKENVPGC